MTKDREKSWTRREPSNGDHTGTNGLEDAAPAAHEG